ncbi:MAG TPA: NAD(P)/FAD-dependent oxidoreductase [Thermoanaerobaculia bacterium]|nr:NAD(P)/FAD-dependent oxidoreductase [Thermoanaerobaculia bacterium]
MALAADILIVGGGPAGLATAIRARLAGMRVLLLERFQPPVDKACGEGLMPDAVARLREIGVELPPRQGVPFRGIRYFDGDLMAEGVFPHAGGLGVRRLHLHDALVRRAGEVGVEIHWGRGVRGLLREGVETDDGPVLARWVVGADGLHSRVRSWAGLDGGAGPIHRFGVRRHYALPPWSDFVEVYWASGSPGCEAYVTPVTPDEIGVALLWSGGKSRFDDLLQRFPVLRGRLAGAPAASRDRGAGPLHQQVRAVCRGNVALVGDAAGYLDAITGEGLAVALHQSAALAEALRAGDLALYAAAHRRIARLPDFMTSLVLSLERRPGLRRRAVKALAAEPALFSRLLGIHGRTLPPRRLGLDGALRLAWRLVAA